MCKKTFAFWRSCSSALSTIRSFAAVEITRIKLCEESIVVGEAKFKSKFLVNVTDESGIKPFIPSLGGTNREPVTTLNVEMLKVLGRKLWSRFAQMYSQRQATPFENECPS